MKTKKLQKKLVLSKETISTLDIPEMLKVDGGVLGTNYSICPTCNVSECYRRTACIVCSGDYC